MLKPFRNNVRMLANKSAVTDFCDRVNGLKTPLALRGLNTSYTRTCLNIFTTV